MLLRKNVEEGLIHYIGGEKTRVDLTDANAIIEMSLNVENFVQVSLTVESQTVNKVKRALLRLHSLAHEQGLVDVRSETGELSRGTTCCLFCEPDKMARSHEVFDVELVVRSDEISDFFALFKVPNSGHPVELDLNQVLTSSFLPNYEVLIHLIQHEQTEVLEVKV